VVDVVGQTINGRAAHIFDALSTWSSLQAHDAAAEPEPRKVNPTRLFVRLPTPTAVYRNPRGTSPTANAYAALTNSP
jgi:hypothetical protein